MRPPIQPVAPRIDDPIELLLACHDKVRRFATLALKLRDHLAQTGPDPQAQEAAQSILRYFEMAAPLHHQDEELDLFPALRALNQPTLTACIDELDAEHAELGVLWGALQPWLRDTVAGLPTGTPPQVDEFAQRYTAHAQREEVEVYPSASQLTPEQVKRISAAMVVRRTSNGTHSPD
ncbi:MAG: hemerythrin domain-containing protein [Pseudomonadota bacterium]